MFNDKEFQSDRLVWYRITFALIGSQVHDCRRNTDYTKYSTLTNDYAAS